MMRLKMVPPVISRIIQSRLSEVANKIAVLRPFDDPSKRVEKDLTNEELQPFLEAVVEDLNKGHNVVAVDVGKMHIEDFCFSQHTVGSNISTFLSNSDTIKNISARTRRDIVFLEGVKIKGSDKIDIRMPDDYSWESRIREPETFYAVLADKRKLSSIAA